MGLACRLRSYGSQMKRQSDCGREIIDFNKKHCFQSMLVAVFANLCEINAHHCNLYIKHYLLMIMFKMPNLSLKYKLHINK